MSRYIIPLMIFISGLLLYSNTVHYPFQFDDGLMIIDNYRLRDLSGFWPPSGQRYVGFLTLALNYSFGGLDTFGYHLTNIAIHSTNAVLVYWLMLLTFRTPFLSKYIAAGIGRMPYAPTAHVSRLTSHAALIPSLLFLFHPVQTQAVTYIIQRFASLATMFYLLALIFYIKARLNQPHPHPDPPLEGEGNKSPLPQGEGKGEGGLLFLTSHVSRLTVLYYALSILSTFLAMGSKEIAATLPVAIVLYEFFFFPSERNRLKGIVYYFVPLFLTIVLIPLSLMNTNRPLGELIGDISNVTRETAVISRGDYFLTQMRVIATYIRLLFLPVNQNLDYDYPLYQSILHPEVFLSILLHLSLISLAVYLFKRSRKTRNGLLLPISFGIIWFYLTLSIESSVIPIRDVIFEHRLYLPSIGAFMAIGTGVVYIFAHPHPSPLPDGEGAHLFPPLQGEGQGGDGADRYSRLTVFLISVIVILLLFSAATFHRNRVWESPLTLWGDVVKKSPYKARGYNNLGFSWYRRSSIERAIKNYNEALRLNPYYIDARHNLGLAYYKQGRLNDAVREYREALRLNPGLAKAHSDLANAYRDQGLIEDAIREYKKAVELKPDFLRARNNLAVMYGSINLLDESVMEFKEILRLSPDDMEANFNLGVIYKMKGANDEARAAFERALRLDPGNDVVRQALESVKYQ